MGDRFNTFLTYTAIAAITVAMAVPNYIRSQYDPTKKEERAAEVETREDLQTNEGISSLVQDTPYLTSTATEYNPLSAEQPYGPPSLLETTVFPPECYPDALSMNRMMPWLCEQARKHVEAGTYQQWKDQQRKTYTEQLPKSPEPTMLLEV